MRVYKLRDRASQKFINKNHNNADRLYQSRQPAASAATRIAERDWRRVNDVSWWKLTPEERREYRESIIEIVEFDAVEVQHGDVAVANTHE